MKITAKQIEAGMTIAVSSIYDNRDIYERHIASPGYLSKSDIDRMQHQLNNSLTLKVGLGSIKKTSPRLVVSDVTYSNSWSYKSNDRTVTFNSIYLHTDKGVIEIGHRQKVELIK